MRIEDLSNMSESELRTRASECLEKFGESNTSLMEEEHSAATAQFYLAEIERRKQAQERIDGGRIAKRDFWLEVSVIGLIGAELVIALMSYREGNKQMEVLDKLNQSSAATAGTLTAVRQAQEASLETQKHTLENIVAMNSALQDEMDLNITEALQFSGARGGGQEQISFSNRGRTTLFVWGSKFDGEPRKMHQKETVVVPNDSVTFDVSAVVKRFVQTRGGSAPITIPFELYFKRENGTEYVSK